MWQKLERVKGAHHELSKLALLPADDCEVLLVSSRTLAILANLAQHEATWSARYMVDYGPGNVAEPVRATDSEYDLYADVVRNFRLEVVPVTCDLTAALSAITSAINNLADKVAQQTTIDLCCPEGTGTQPPADEVDISDAPIGPGEEFETLADYYDAKCNTANWLVDDLILLITDFQIRDIQELAAGSVTIAWAMVGVAIAASGVGALAGAVVGLLGAIVSLVLGPVLFDLSDLATVLNAKRDALKQALFCSISTTDAKSRFLAELEGEGLSLLEVEFVSLFLNNNVLLVLFQPTEETKLYDGGYTCLDCGNSCDWMIAPAAMGISRGFTSVSTAECGTINSGFLDNETETVFQLQSVLGEISATPVQLVMMCTREFYEAWLANGQVIPAGYACECDETGSPDGHKSIEITERIGGAFSVWRRRCVGGTQQDIGVAAFTADVEYTLSAFAWHRNNTSGPFTVSFKVLVP
jgi:hypothetical protein